MGASDNGLLFVFTAFLLLACAVWMLVVRRKRRREGKPLLIEYDAFSWRWNWQPVSDRTWFLWTGFFAAGAAANLASALELAMLLDLSKILLVFFLIGGLLSIVVDELLASRNKR